MLNSRSENIFYSWQDIDDAVNLIVSSLESIPDLIVGIARGGLVPAVMFSHALNKPLEVLYWSTRDFQKQKVDLLIELAQSNQDVLLVDDFVDSGKTLVQIKDAISEHCPNLNYKIATLIYNVGQQLIIPDYYCDFIDRRVDQRWITFAYERE